MYFSSKYSWLKRSRLLCVWDKAVMFSGVPYLSPWPSWAVLRESTHAVQLNCILLSKVRRAAPLTTTPPQHRTFYAFLSLHSVSPTLQSTIQISSATFPSTHIVWLKTIFSQAKLHQFLCLAVKRATVWFYVLRCCRKWEPMNTYIEWLDSI
jgi:hypothetical protein